MQRKPILISKAASYILTEEANIQVRIIGRNCKKYGIIQSMNSSGGRCHDNARCESIWARMKEELFYSRGDKSENYTMSELKTMIWRYYMSYWANRRICTANGGLPSAVKRKRYYESANLAA